jgi:hypothetical protein
LGNTGSSRLRFESTQVTRSLHEKPKLASVEFKGDQQNPIYQEVDLKNLPTEDLHALARILPKLGGATGLDRSDGRDLKRRRVVRCDDPGR